MRVQNMSGLGTSLLKLWTDGLVYFSKRFQCILLPCHIVCLYNIIMIYVNIYTVYSVYESVEAHG